MKACYDLGISYAVTGIHEDLNGIAGIDMKQACEWFQRAADLGDPKAMAELGFWCGLGIGVPKDEKKAKDLLIKAAQKGGINPEYLSAMSRRGFYENALIKKAHPELYTAEGVESVKKLVAAVLIDLPAALEAEFKAVKERATAGDIASQFDLANSFNTGKGTPADKKMASEWYQKAATSGHAEAQYCLGMQLVRGETGSKDLEGGCGWLEKSMAQGFEKAKLMLEELANTGMVEAQIVLVPKQIRLCVKDAIAGNANVQWVLATIYLEGKIVPEDKKKAYEWFEKSATNGNLEAQVKLAQDYCFGRGLPLDIKKSEYWHKKAAEQGDAKMQHSLGLLYSTGHPDLKMTEEVATQEACRWLQKAAEQGELKAKNRLEEMASKGVTAAKLAVVQLDFSEKPSTPPLHLPDLDIVKEALLKFVFPDAAEGKGLKEQQAVSSDKEKAKTRVFN